MARNKPLVSGGGYIDRLNQELAAMTPEQFGQIYTGPRFNPDGTIAETPSGGGGGGGGAAPVVERDYAQEYYANLERQRRTNAIAVVRGLLGQYGLESLYNTIVGYIQDGYDPDSVMALIRTTPEYKQRFPAMEALAKKGRAISEAEYIAYERDAAGLERQYGLPAGMLGRDKVAQLLEREVSARELEERVTMAAAGAFQTSPEVQKTFQDFYGIGTGGLTAYFLDPEVATPLLNKQYVSARIGAEAARNQISADRTLAEMLQVEGVTADEARAGFQKVASQRELTTGRGDVVSQQTLIQGNLLGNQAAQQEMERVGMSRVGRFQGGGGGFAGTQQGPSGLREATT